MDDVLHALAQPTRREILQMVRDREMPASEIAARFQVSRPAVSQHLKVLREAHLVTERREGTRRFYRARPEGLVDVRRFLEVFWDYRLERLREVAEEEHRL